MFITYYFGSMPLKSLGCNKYTSAATDTASKMRRMTMINPSTPPIVSAIDLESLFRFSHDIVGIPLSGISIVVVSMQTLDLLAVYDPCTADTQQLYEVEGKRPNISRLKVSLFTNIFV